MLQWCEKPELVLQEAHRVLKPGGLAVISTLLDGTLQEFKQAWAQVDQYQHINQFLPLNFYQQLAQDLPELGLRLQTELVQLDYPDVLALARPGATFLLNSPYGPEEVWDHLPRSVQQQIMDKKLRFYVINAYDVAKENGVPNVILNALQEATELSLANMPKLGDRVWVILDCSGSMGSSISTSYGRIDNNTPIKVGAIFAAALSKAAKDSFEFKLTMFDDYAKHVDLNPRDSVFTNYAKIMNRRFGLIGAVNLRDPPARGGRP